jgi:diguanylate cyclase (GGDEF)-like protein
MKRKIRGLAIFLAALLMPALGMAASAMNSLRSRTVNDPRGLIVDVRQQLDRSGARLASAQEVALLWGMGTAAINANDDAAFAEATLRLDGLASASNDPLAAAAAGFLRSRHDIANGTGDGMGEALRAADKVLGNADPELVAWARFQLCDAYTLDEKPDRALPLCRQVKNDYQALGDEWGVGDAENDEGIALATLNRVDEAAKAYESSRRHFKFAGGPRMAVSVGDNLSQMYLKQGRAREALQLSQTSLKQELADGRVSDAIGSDTDIARAMAALGEHSQAYALMKATVVKARTAGMNGQLSDLLEVESALAEQAGDLHQALADEREVVKLENATNTPALRAIEAELEQRYAAREKQLRIELELKTAQAEAARRDEAQRGQKLANLVFTIVAVGLVLFAGLLFMLLREQRRHAAELRAQALCDPLTGIENRRAFQQRATALLARQRDMRDPLHVMMLIDFDHFKHINDTVGHQQGDRVLVLVTDYLRRAIGNAGHIARIGGEEFIVLCPQLGAENGMRLAETLRAGVAAMALPVELGVSKITISIGVALFDGERCHDVSSWMRAADTALYSAKSYGRDRVVASTLVS